MTTNESGPSTPSREAEVKPVAWLYERRDEYGRAAFIEFGQRETCPEEYRCRPLYAAPPSSAIREALVSLRRAYVQALSDGYERIVNLGGQCDSIDKMLADDPALKQADAALAADPGSGK